MIGNQHLWGESWTIYRDKGVWVVGFRGKAGGESSTHYHHGMAHSVVLTSDGIMTVLRPNNPQSFGRIFTLDRHHRQHFLETRERHRLIFHEDSEGIETYYALPGHEIDENDIVRLSPGKAP